MSNYDFSKVISEVEKLADMCKNNYTINPELYVKYDVKRGLRDVNGKGVLAGLTDISEICSSKVVNGESVPCEGELYYRGVNIEDLVDGFIKDDRFGFEETVYLLLFGTLPDKNKLDKFSDLLAEFRNLPTTFVRDIIMKAPSSDIDRKSVV